MKRLVIFCIGVGLIVSAALAYKSDKQATRQGGDKATAAYSDLRDPDHPRSFSAMRKDRGACRKSVGKDAELFQICMRDHGWGVRNAAIGLASR